MVERGPSSKQLVKDGNVQQRHRAPERSLDVHPAHDFSRLFGSVFRRRRVGSSRCGGDLLSARWTRLQDSTSGSPPLPMIV